MTVVLFGLIALEKFEDVPQLGRFTLRDEGVFLWQWNFWVLDLQIGLRACLVHLGGFVAPQMVLRRILEKK